MNMKTNVFDTKKELEGLAKRLNLKSIEEALLFPKYFQIETVHLCNAKCCYCTVNQWDTTKKFMDDDLYDRIAEEIIEYKDWVERVCLARAGEPLLDKKLVARVKHLKDKGVKYVNISTNVALLHEKASRELLEAGIDEVMLSIDSLHEETYYKIKSGIDFHRVLKNAKKYIQLRNEINPKSLVRMRAVLRPENEGEQHEWEAYWKDYLRKDDRIYFKYQHSWGNQLQGSPEVTPDQYTYDPCVILWSSMNITSNGSVAMCNADYEAKMNLGDLNKRTIYKAWHSEQYQKLRAFHAAGKKNDLLFCRGCRIWDLEHRLEKSE
jgi:radical SAM protein with 4Fe4S-binding SPASM domain